MASSFTTNFGFEEMATGEQSGTWGTTTNYNFDILDRITSYKAVALSDASTATLTVREASPGQATENLQDGMYRVIKFTGSLGQDCTVTIAPNTTTAWFIIENAAGDDVILSQGSGANVTVQNGKNVIVYCDGAGSGAAVVDALADLQIGTLECTGAAAIDGAATFGSTVTVGVDDTGYDVKFFGDTASRYWLWDTSADGVVQRGTLTVGVDDTGHDVKFFGATSGRYWLWDESADGVVQLGTLTVGVDDTGHDVKFFGATSGKSLLWDESADSLIVTGSTSAQGTLTVGVDDTGYDVKFFGATSGKSLLWDESADSLIVTGSTSAQGTLTVGVDDTGYDVKLFGATSGKYALWDESADSWIISGTQSTVTAGTSNYIAGVNAGNSIESGGNYNVAVGDEAGTAMTTADNNTLVGYAAGDAITTGLMNTAMGGHAGGELTTAENNTLIGFMTGDVLTTGNGNVHIGGGAGGAQTTGTNSICIGVNAGNNLVDNTAGNAIIIGYAAQASASDLGGHEVVIGPGTGKGVNTAFVVAGGNVFKGDNGTTWAQTSDRRIKKDIQPNTKGLAEICQIDPKTFLYKSDEELQEVPEFVGCSEGLPQDKRITSAIAQDVQIPFPEAVTERNPYGMLTVNTDPIFWAMIGAIKELSTKLDEALVRITELEGE